MTRLRPAIAEKGLYGDRLGRDESRDDLPGLADQGKIDRPGEGSALRVDFDDERAGVLCGKGERGGRLDHSGRADDEHQVAGGGKTVGAVQKAGVQAFTEPDDVGAERGAAPSAGGRRSEVRLFLQMDISAARAADLPDVAVDLEDVPAAGLEMQAVDVLGDQREIGRALFHGSERMVSGVAVHLADDDAPPVVEFPDEGRIAREGLRRRQIRRPVIAPEAALASEGRDAAFRGHACPGEDDDPFCCPKPLPDGIDIAMHGS